MSFFFNGTQANVTLSSAQGIPTPASNQAPYAYNITLNGGAQDAYTVPANKIFYIYGASLEGDAASAPHGGNIYKNDGATVIFKLTATGASAFISSSTPLHGYAAAEKVKVAGTNTYGLTFWGLLIDA